MSKNIIHRLRKFDTAQLVVMYNHYSARPVEKFSDRYTAESRLATLLHERGLYPWHEPAPNCLERLDKDIYMFEWRHDPAMKLRDESYVKDIELSDRIRVLTNANPKRKGSQAYERFEDYRDGMLVFEWYDLNAKKRGHHGRHAAASDLLYDREHGFIDIVRTDINLNEIG